MGQNSSRLRHDNHNQHQQQREQGVVGVRPTTVPVSADSSSSSPNKYEEVAASGSANTPSSQLESVDQDNTTLLHPPVADGGLRNLKDSASSPSSSLSSPSPSSCLSPQASPSSMSLQSAPGGLQSLQQHESTSHPQMPLSQQQTSHVLYAPSPHKASKRRSLMSLVKPMSIRERVSSFTAPRGGSLTPPSTRTGDSVMEGITTPNRSSTASQIGRMWRGSRIMGRGGGGVENGIAGRVMGNGVVGSEMTTVNGTAKGKGKERAEEEVEGNNGVNGDGVAQTDIGMDMKREETGVRGDKAVDPRTGSCSSVTALGSPKPPQEENRGGEDDDEEHVYHWHDAESSNGLGSRTASSLPLPVAKETSVTEASLSAPVLPTTVTDSTTRTGGDDAGSAIMRGTELATAADDGGATSCSTEHESSLSVPVSPPLAESMGTTSSASQNTSSTAWTAPSTSQNISSNSQTTTSSTESTSLPSLSSPPPLNPTISSSQTTSPSPQITPASPQTTSAIPQPTTPSPAIPTSPTTTPQPARAFPPPGTLVVVQGIVHTTDVTRLPTRTGDNLRSRPGSRPVSGLSTQSQSPNSDSRAGVAGSTAAGAASASSASGGETGLASPVASPSRNSIVSMPGTSTATSSRPGTSTGTSTPTSTTSRTRNRLSALLGRTGMGGRPRSAEAGSLGLGERGGAGGSVPALFVTPPSDGDVAASASAGASAVREGGLNADEEVEEDVWGSESVREGGEEERRHESTGAAAREEEGSGNGNGNTAISSSSIDVLGTLLSVAAAATAASLLTGSSEPILSSGLAPPSPSTSSGSGTNPQANANAATSSSSASQASSSSISLEPTPLAPAPANATGEPHVPHNFNNTAMGGAERMRQAWSTIRERLGLGMRGAAPGAAPFLPGNGTANRNEAGVDGGETRTVNGDGDDATSESGVGATGGGNNVQDTRELMLAEMARAFNIGLGLTPGSANAGVEAGANGSSAGSNTGAGSNGSNSNANASRGTFAGAGGQGALPAEGSFERFLVDLQIELRAALTAADEGIDVDERVGGVEGVLGGGGRVGANTNANMDRETEPRREDAAVPIPTTASTDNSVNVPVNDDVGGDVIEVSGDANEATRRSREEDEAEAAILAWAAGGVSAGNEEGREDDMPGLEVVSDSDDDEERQVVESSAPVVAVEGGDAEEEGEGNDRSSMPGLASVSHSESDGDESDTSMPGLASVSDSDSESDEDSEGSVFDSGEDEDDFHSLDLRLPVAVGPTTSTASEPMTAAPTEPIFTTASAPSVLPDTLPNPHAASPANPPSFASTSAFGPGPSRPNLNPSASERERVNGRMDSSGRINWWRLYRFPPIVAQRGAASDAATTGRDTATPAASSSTATAGTQTDVEGQVEQAEGDVSSPISSRTVVDHGSAEEGAAAAPAVDSEQGTSAPSVSPTGATSPPPASLPLNSVVPVILVGLQSVNQDGQNLPPQLAQHHNHNHAHRRTGRSPIPDEDFDLFGRGDVDSDEEDDEDEGGEESGEDDDDWETQEQRERERREQERRANRTSRWQSRAANAIRNLRGGSRRREGAAAGEGRDAGSAGSGAPGENPLNSPGSRTFLIYVIGGYYPPDHSIVTGGPANFDSFEALLELADLLGQVKPPTVSKDEIEKSGLEIIKASEMETYRDKGKVSDNCMDRCLICLDDYQPEDDVRLMTCRHAFHKMCVDEWLQKGRNNCPACRSTGVSTGAEATSAS
ncbi:hypothetical protein CVT24_001672 [Panaeolus cyanescens]|uniref:RING-type domain-containing protein n=1 Tax=Panaeolus cyanescens TaxID=181874 RepID=A0A409VSY4_9AGAR|nr:hypothetical protein CVT24_001672 [Panaeolus cyanescens]